METTSNTAVPALIEHIDVCAEMSAEARISVQSAMRILEVLEWLVSESWLNDEAVDLPAIGVLDAIDRDENPDGSPVRVRQIAEFAAQIATEAGVEIDRVRRALAAAVIFINERRSAGDVVWVPVLGFDGAPEAIKAIDAGRTRRAIEILRSTARPIWLVQCNPNNYDIDAAIEADGMPESWTVARRFDDIEVGDVVVFWMAGPDSGVYGVGHITKTPFAGHLDEFGGADAGKSATMVGIDLFLDLWQRPVLRADLKGLPEFADETIITCPSQANPHTLERKPLDAILARVAI